MGYTTFKPFLGSWGVYDFPILALLGVTGASQSTLFCTRVIGPFGFLQCLVFSYSCRLMILHSFFLFLFFCFILDVERLLFYLSSY